jgi:hypothetical protein
MTTPRFHFEQLDSRRLYCSPGSADRLWLAHCGIVWDADSSAPVELRLTAGDHRLLRRIGIERIKQIESERSAIVSSDATN